MLRADWNAGVRLLECKACQRTWAHKGELERVDSELAGVVKKSVRDRKGRDGGFDGLIDFRAGVERPDRCQRVDFRPAVGPASEAK